MSITNSQSFFKLKEIYLSIITKNSQNIKRDKNFTSLINHQSFISISQAHQHIIYIYIDNQYVKDKDIQTQINN